MSSSVKTISKIMSISTIVIGICILPLIFSSGCNYDPYQSVATSDTITYKVSGVITNENKEGQRYFRVSLFDSVSSNKSPAVVTDTVGNYSITWLYIRRSSLYLQVEDPKSVYKSAEEKLTFSAEDIKYSFLKSKDVVLSLK